MIKRVIPALVLLIVSLPLSARGVQDGAAPSEPGGEAVPAVLTIGLMPAVDTAPIFLARDAGYFDDEGIQVEIQLYTNAQDRQSALQTGSIDGAMTDLVAVAVNVAGGFDIRATTLTDGMFPILANPGAAGKTKVSVGMMEVSVSNFLVDHWLGESYEVDKVYVNAIPARLEAVASGQLDMGLFPEPVASVGAVRGLEKMLFTPPGGFSPDVMVFTGRAMAEKDDAIRAFHRAYNRAIGDILADEDIARDTLMASIPNLKPGLRDLITLPTYHEARLPDEAYLQSIIDWTRGIVGRELAVDPADMVERRYVD